MKYCSKELITLLCASIWVIVFITDEYYKLYFYYFKRYFLVESYICVEFLPFFFFFLNCIYFVYWHAHFRKQRKWTLHQDLNLNLPSYEEPLFNPAYFRPLDYGQPSKVLFALKHICLFRFFHESYICSVSYLKPKQNNF